MTLGAFCAPHAQQMPGCVLMGRSSVVTRPLDMLGFLVCAVVLTVLGLAPRFAATLGGAVRSERGARPPFRETYKGRTRALRSERLSLRRGTQGCLYTWQGIGSAKGGVFTGLSAACRRPSDTTCVDDTGPVIVWARITDAL